MKTLILLCCFLATSALADSFSDGFNSAFDRAYSGPNQFEQLKRKVDDQEAEISDMKYQNQLQQISSQPGGNCFLAKYYKEITPGNYSKQHVADQLIKQYCK